MDSVSPPSPISSDDEIDEIETKLVKMGWKMYPKGWPSTNHMAWRDTNKHMEVYNMCTRKIYTCPIAGFWLNTDHLAKIYEGEFDELNHVLLTSGSRRVPKPKRYLQPPSPPPPRRRQPPSQHQQQIIQQQTLPPAPQEVVSTSIIEVTKIPQLQSELKRLKTTTLEKQRNGIVLYREALKGWKEKCKLETKLFQSKIKKLKKDAVVSIDAINKKQGNVEKKLEMLQNKLDELVIKNKECKIEKQSIMKDIEKYMNEFEPLELPPPPPPPKSEHETVSIVFEKSTETIFKEILVSALKTAILEGLVGYNELNAPSGVKFGERTKNTFFKTFRSTSTILKLFKKIILPGNWGVQPFLKLVGLDASLPHVYMENEHGSLILIEEEEERKTAIQRKERGTVLVNVKDYISLKYINVEPKLKISITFARKVSIPSRDESTWRER